MVSVRFVGVGVSHVESQFAEALFLFWRGHPRRSSNLRRVSRLSFLAPPPRPVPLTLRIPVVLGGLLQQFGWMFAFIGTLGLVAFVVAGGVFEGLAKSTAYSGPTKTVQGVVLGSFSTGAEVNERDVVRYLFEYKVDGLAVVGECYTTGWLYDDGDEVNVDYLVSDPSLALIQGGRWSQFPHWVALLILIFPAVGATLGFVGLRQGLAASRLLTYGRVATGELLSKEDSGSRVNDHIVYNYTFRFTAESTGREHLATASTHEEDLLEDEEQELLLYLPSHPETAVLFDSLPGKPSISAQGKLEGGGFFLSIGYLFCPMTTVLGWLLVVNSALEAFS